MGPDGKAVGRLDGMFSLGAIGAFDVKTTGTLVGREVGKGEGRRLGLAVGSLFAELTMPRFTKDASNFL